MHTFGLVLAVAFYGGGALAVAAWLCAILLAPIWAVINEAVRLVTRRS